MSCQALVNPPMQGNSALAPRLVTPQSLEGFGADSARVDASRAETVKAEPAKSGDDSWRREVLERVRKRRQVRTHALPLFVDGQGPTGDAGNLPPASSLDLAIVEQLTGALETPAPRPIDAPPTPVDGLSDPSSDDDLLDLPLRPAEDNDAALRAPSQTIVERPRPTLVSSPTGTRSLVADLPLVEPTRSEPTPGELPPRAAPSAVNPRVASMNDRVQAAFIDLGLWSAMSVGAFYFASRIARTSVLGLAPAWQGLALFGVVLASAYILFFGGLTGATPGKIACGIQVRRHDGSSLGPLASLGRGVLGILGVALLGAGVWPAFWDRDRRTLHDRATDSRVTTV